MWNKGLNEEVFQDTLCLPHLQKTNHDHVYFNLKRVCANKFMSFYYVSL